MTKATHSLTRGEKKGNQEMNGGRDRSKPELPKYLKIGQRLLVSFESPEWATAQYRGRLHNMSKDGLLCIDAPIDLRPPAGTAVKVSSIQRAGGRQYSFLSEIQARGRLKGHLPIFLLRTPSRVERIHQRSAYRITVALGAKLEWAGVKSDAQERESRPAVVTNLSGGGAQVFLRQLPPKDLLELTLTTPADFVEEQAKRRQPGRDTTWLPAAREPYLQSCDETQSHLSGIRAAVVETRVHLEDDRGTIYAVSLAFREPQEHCYQLVRYLERQAIRRGVGNSRPQDADRSLLPCAATRRTTAARSWEQWRLEHPLIHKM